MNKMIAKQKIFTALKYIGYFALCNVLLWLITLLIAELDQDKLELINCYAFEYGRITETFDYQSYLQGHCIYPKICTCALTSAWIIFFYILALPIFVFNEVFRRKIIPYQYAYLFVLGEIAFWSMLCFISQDSAPVLWFPLDNTYKIITPMSIIMLTLHSLPPKVLRALSIIIGTIYGIYCCTMMLMMLPNFWR